MKVIIVIDDDVEDHETIKLAFYAANPNTHCICFTDCDEAISRLSDHTIPHIDCILVDLHMPKMNGIECLEALKKVPELIDVDILLMSCEFRENDLHEMCRHGATALWIKPQHWVEYVKMASLILEGKIESGNIMSV
jgi:CheY-like chemotaxis protein